MRSAVDDGLGHGFLEVGEELGREAGGVGQLELLEEGQLGEVAEPRRRQETAPWGRTRLVSVFLNF